MRDTFVFRSAAGEKRSRDEMEGEDSEELAFRGCSSWDLETCLEDVEGLHFAWTHKKAKEYAIPEAYTKLGYVIEVSPFHLYMTGATMHHGAQWYTYSKFEIEDKNKPVVWEELVELVHSWKTAIQELQTAAQEAVAVPERTLATYLQTKRWKPPDADVQKLLETADEQSCPEWNDEERVALLENWKRMVYAAVRAAPWNYPGPSDEFVAEGGDVYKCVQKITEYKLHENDHTEEDGNDHTEEVVYSSIPLSPLGTPEARTQFLNWLGDTAGPGE